MKKTQAKKKIVVIGGGFAGLHLVEKLDGNFFDILLIDKINHHQFQPLFYQVATSQLEPSSISFPLRHVFKRRMNVSIRLAEVLSIDRINNKVITTIGAFDYDTLIIATGCQTNFFGNDNLEKNTFSLKSTTDALTIRNHILQTFEKIISAKEEEREALLKFVIVGGGPTGVELAGALAEIKTNVLPKDYREIDFTKLEIILVEGSKNTLNNMSDKSKAASRTYLEQMGVTVCTEMIVKSYDGTVLTLTTGEPIKTKTVIWAAGVTGNKIEGFTPEMIAHGNRLKVDTVNKVLLNENIFAIGDIALMETKQFPKGHPQLAAVAIQQANVLAKNLNRIEQNKKTIEFKYKDRGSMATIGRNKAVVDLPSFHFKGYLAWLTWMFTHLMLILSVKSKLIIFINWTWAYITKDTSLGLILIRENQKQKNETDAKTKYLIEEEALN